MSDIDRRSAARKLSPRQYAAIRLCELVALARCRSWLGVETDARNWFFVACHTLAPLKEREGGLDIEHVRDLMRACQMIADENDLDAAAVIIHKVCRFRKAHPHAHGLTAKAVGKLLELTDEERWLCAEKYGRPITTMWAIDKTPEQDKSVRDNRDRERKQRERRDKGCPTREQWLAANTLSKDKPWDLARPRMSRAKYYRLRAQGAIRVGRPARPVRQVVPPTYSERKDMSRTDLSHVAPVSLSGHDLWLMLCRRMQQEIQQ